MKKSIISESSDIARKLKVFDKKRKSIRDKFTQAERKFDFKVEKLVADTKEKESIRKKLVVFARKLAVTAKEKEAVRKKLVVTAEKLAKTAEEKEIIRKKLVVFAAKLAVAAKEKEIVSKKLVITAKKLAETAKEKEVEMKKEEAILASIGDAVMACDQSGRIVLFNRVAEELTGYSFKEAFGKPYSKILNFIKEDDRKKSHDFILEAIKTGKKTAMVNHTLVIRKDGEEIPVADSAAPIFSIEKKIGGCVVVFRDVTHDRSVDKAKTEFVSLAAHQLKTPPTAIKWLTEILLDENSDRLTTKQRGFITDLRNEGETMAKLVNSFLNVSRIELGNFSITPARVDINALVRGVVEELKFEISAKGLRLRQNFSKSKLIVSTDASLFRMVIQNLITNAIHYNSDKGEIKIEVLSKSKGQSLGGRTLDSTCVALAVSDNGCGIPKNQQSMIFTKLFRADNARAKYNGGTGLGLYIVKSILDNLGGAVWFNSKENKGSTFFVTIPLSGVKAKAGEKKLT